MSSPRTTKYLTRAQQSMLEQMRGGTTASERGTLIPTPPRVRTVSQRKPGERAPSSEWASATNLILSAAQGERTAAAHLKGETAKLSTSTVKKVNEVENSVTERLKKKIQLTKSLKQKLESTHELLEMEGKNLRVQQEQCTTAVERLRSRATEKVAKRAEIRSQRPPGENIEDKVSRAVDNQRGIVSEHVGVLESLLLKAARQQDAMTKALRNIKADINDKSAALAVELQCLNVEGSGEPSVALEPTSPSGKKSQSSTWREGTKTLLELAKELMNVSADLRMTIQNAVKRAESTTKHGNSTVVEALSKKVSQTEAYTRQLQTQLAKIDGDVKTLERQKTRAQTALRERERPISVVQRRIELRKQRPTREQMRDEVDDAIERELIELQEGSSALESKIATIDAEVAKLRQAQLNLMKNLEDKSIAIALEKECLDIETPAGTPADSRMSSKPGTPRLATPRSNASSPRTPRL